MDNKKLDFGGGDITGQLEKQISLEASAIEKYRQQIIDFRSRCYRHFEAYLE